MIITRKEIKQPYSEPFRLHLMSDLHIGAANVDYDLIAREIAAAKASGARVAINGDVFDAILPKDHRRFKPDCLHPLIQGRPDILDAAIEMASDIFSPIKEQIDVIGMGNHESAVEKYHSTDLIARLIRRLGGAAQYGGYEGYIVYRIRKKSPRTKSCAALIVYYHHGGGGAAPVTKGMIDFARKGVWVDSDVVWLGHKHNRIVDSTPLRMRCPHIGDEPVYDKQVFIMTGGYMVRGTQTSAEVMDGGRRSSYAEDAGLAPQATGGVELLVKVDNSHGVRDIRVLI